MRKASAKAQDALESSASAARADLPKLDRSVCRPHLPETRAEVRRHALNAKNDVVDASKAVGQATSRSAKRISEAVRRKARDVRD